MHCGEGTSRLAGRRVVFNGHSICEMRQDELARLAVRERERERNHIFIMISILTAVGLIFSNWTVINAITDSI